MKPKDMTFPDGVTRKVEELEFAIVKEEWNEYQLQNGVMLKIKSVLHKVFWVLDNDGKRMYTGEGDPFILARSSNEVVASEQ